MPSLAPAADNRLSEFAKRLRPVGRILEGPDWYVWDCAPTYDQAGQVHLFVGRWPKQSRMSGWLSAAEIAHAVADHPGGPYEVRATVLKGRREVRWADSVFNSTIHQVDGRYALFFAAHDQTEPNLRQQIGVAVCDSLDGPWRCLNDKPLIPYSDRRGSWNCLHASNPAFLRHPNGQYWIYYKGISDTGDPPLRTIGLGVAGRLEGPYRDHPANPLIDYRDRGVDIEDPYAFYYQGRFYMLLEDRLGVLRHDTGGDAGERPGGIRPGLLYESEDGIHWGEPKISNWTSDHYFGGARERMERPQILWRDGEPEYLFMSLKGGRFGLSSGAVFRIETRNAGGPPGI